MTSIIIYSLSYYHAVNSYAQYLKNEYKEPFDDEKLFINNIGVIIAIKKYILRMHSSWIRIYLHFLSHTVWVYKKCGHAVVTNQTFLTWVIPGAYLAGKGACNCVRTM